VSPAPWDSLNLGLSVWDRRSCVLENRRRLDTTDARGRSIEVVEFDTRGRPSVVGGRTIGTDYLNLYQANGALIVPTGGSAEDQRALEALGEIAGDREIVGVPTPVLGYGGGGIHCITQQVPRSSGVSVAP
jgi:agmatine deiminase